MVQGLPEGVGVLGGGGAKGKIGTTVTAKSIKYNKKRSGIHSVVNHGEAACSNKVPDDNNFMTEFQEYIEAEGFVPQ